MQIERVIDLRGFYSETARLADLPAYMERSIAEAGEGADIVLTGAAPIWMYLKIAHALHGKARRLTYRSPVSGDVIVFDHSPA